jgi:hypothetical protein
MNIPINLDNLRVASPCNARWEDMAGDERARFCGSCRKHVYNLSAMTRPEIETLIREKEGRFCGRYYQRPDGRMLTADCLTGRRQRRSRLARWAGSFCATVMFLLGGRLALRAEETNKTTIGKPGSPRTNCAPVLMGDMVAPPVVMGAPVVMGEFPVLPKTNTTINPPVMGKIALPPKTNSPALEK